MPVNMPIRSWHGWEGTFPIWIITTGILTTTIPCYGDTRNQQESSDWGDGIPQASYDADGSGLNLFGYDMDPLSDMAPIRYNILPFYRKLSDRAVGKSFTVAISSTVLAIPTSNGHIF